MSGNVYVYIAVMSLVSLAVRVLPLTLIRKQIQNPFLRSFLYYVPYVTLAVIVPASKKSKIIMGVVVVSMAASFILANLPFFSGLAEGTRIIILTLVIASAAAVLFPVKEEVHES